ncbi:MAG: NADH-quinone oxidoreductase subunit M, partial [Alphaproteobacteria bacterium]|nr:NADH-quinone oxidoreductase subunit M [Alphaproteobacteria bacterium]
ALIVLVTFDPANTDFQFVEKFKWIPSFGLVYQKGVDGISICFVLITALLSPIAVLSGFSVRQRVKSFMIALLVLETMLIGMFTTLDFVLFYVFFEGVLIPMFLVIGLWGGEKRIYAAAKFFLYTFLGSVFMLVAIMAMAWKTGTTDMTAMMGGKFPKDMAVWLWLAFFASFAVKTPFWPFHTWLPYAHVEAPTAGSVILAGVLLKMGGYGLIRVSLQMLPQASALFAPLVLTLGVIGILYASLAALAQTDMKKLIAYLSIAHMGYAVIGLFSGTIQGLEGGLFVMISHAFVSAALFLGTGVVYDRLHTREIACFGGMAINMPRYAALFMIFMLAAVGLPGTSGFVGEFLSLQGVARTSAPAAAFAVLGVVLGAAPLLVLYRKMFFGPLDKDDVKALPDLTRREVAMLLPLAALIIVLGLYPAPLRHVFAPTAAKVLADYRAQSGETP